MFKKVIITRKAFEGLLERRRHPETLPSEDIDPLALVGPEFPWQRGACGYVKESTSPVPVPARRLLQEAAEKLDRQAKPLTTEEKAEVETEWEEFLANE